MSTAPRGLPRPDSARRIDADAWIGIALAAAAFAPFAATVFYGFVYDDTAIVLHNPVIAGWRALFDVWRHPYWANGGGPDSAGLYRPLLMLVFALLWNGAHGFALVFHLLAVGSHVAVTLLVWQLLRRAVGRWSAAAAALWFAVLPVHVEAVANIANCSEVLVALWTLLLVSMLARDADSIAVSRPSGWRLLGCGALFAAALLTKESGAMAPALALLAVYGWAPPRGTRTGDRAAIAESGLVPVRLSALGQWCLAWRRVLLLWFAVAVAVAVMRHRVLGGVVSGASIAAPGLESLTTPERIRAMLALGPRVAQLLFWPTVLNPHYGPSVLRNGCAASVAALLTIAALLLVLFGCVRLARASSTRDSRALAAVLWCLAAFLPASNVLTATGQILAERTLYVSSVGAAMLIAYVLDRLAFAVREHESAARRLVPVFGAVLVVLACARNYARTRSYAQVWKDHVTLFSAMIGADSASYRGYQLLALEVKRRGHPHEAARLYARAYELYPRDRILSADYAEFLLEQGRYREAVPVARGLVAHGDMRSNPRAVMLLLTALADSYGVDSLMPTALDLDRTAPTAQSALFVGMGYAARGDTAAARAEYQLGLHRAPGDTLLLDRMGRLGAGGGSGFHDSAVGDSARR